MSIDMKSNPLFHEYCHPSMAAMHDCQSTGHCKLPVKLKETNPTEPQTRPQLHSAPM